MNNLDKWLNGVLVDLGLPAVVASLLDQIIIILGILLFAYIVDYICKKFILVAIKKLAKRTSYRWDDILFQRKVINYLIHMIPAILVYILLPSFFEEGRTITALLRKACVVYIIFAFLMVMNGLILTVFDIYQLHRSDGRRPIKGFTQVLQVLLFFVGAIIIIGVIINRSPTALFAGLGASAAILSLVFKDILVGFIAGVQLSMNDMVRPGDWITLADNKTDGIVQEITLITVKIKNFDNSISTVPPTILVTNTFKNWREINKSSGRPVRKIIYLDKSTIQFTIPEQQEKLKKDFPLLTDFKTENDETPTNSQLFRYYMERYLNTHSKIDKLMEIKISQQEITDRGVPLEFNFFCLTSSDKEYAELQSDIFDHAIAIIPAFGLKIT